MIAVRHGDASELKGVRKHLEAHPELLEAGPAAAVWAIVDKVVDDYQPVVEGIDNDISEVETEIFGERADSTQRIYFLKREVIEFHHATGAAALAARVARARRLPEHGRAAAPLLPRRRRPRPPRRRAGHARSASC